MESTLTTPAHTGDPALTRDVKKRRTFAIISHPDAGKTTLTEKLLLFGGAIQMAGTVKGKKSGKFATSDWMAVEQEAAEAGGTLTPKRPAVPDDWGVHSPSHEQFSMGAPPRVIPIFAATPPYAAA